MNHNPNPMRWDCSADGCFNKLKRPPIELFNPCFSRGINFGDVDAEVEIGGGRILKLEWKESRTITQGQLTSFINQTRVNYITVIQIEARLQHPNPPDVSAFRVFESGAAGPWRDGGFTELQALVAAWYQLAKNSPTLPDRVEPNFPSNPKIHAELRSKFTSLCS